MSKTREILRLRWTLERSVREAARAPNLSVDVVAKTENRARPAGLDADGLDALNDDDTLERRLYGGAKHSRGRTRPVPDPG